MSVVCHPCALLNGMSMNHLLAFISWHLLLAIEIMRTVLAQEKKKTFLSNSKIQEAMNVAVKSNLNEIHQVLFFKLSKT